MRISDWSSDVCSSDLQYWELTKPRVVSLIVFTAVVGMFLAVPGLPPLRESVFGLLGIWLAAASAAAINHLLDQRIDQVMARTANRPLATGTLTTGSEACRERVRNYIESSGFDR